MIHGLKLPEITRQRLMDIVLLQIDLLYFAASCNEVDKDHCARYLDDHPLAEQFKGRGQAIADWLWKLHTTTRHENLARFARLGQEECQTKLTWCLRLQKEVCEFAELHTNTEKICIEIGNFFDGESPRRNRSESRQTWQSAAKDFLLYFYETYLGADKPFPAELYSGDKREDFGRTQLLGAFFEENQGLEICPVCDVAHYYMHGQKTVHTVLDHYLPKSLYPHFSCHPYNLIPVCYFCNSVVKGETDPLRDEPNGHQPLCRSELPYGTFDLSSYAYLDVEVKEPGDPITIHALRARPDKLDLVGDELQRAIAVIAGVYDIPGRWEKASNTISETLFRRIRQFLGRSSTMATALPTGFDVPQEVANLLEQLLFYLSDKNEDSGKDPYAFAMTWILVALINEYVQPAAEAHKEKQPNNDTPNYDPSLLQEFVSWFGQDLQENDIRSRKARELLHVLRQGS